MYPKRFIQLFVIFFVTVIIAELLADVSGMEALWPHIFFVTVIGYLVLVTPLTILTIMKNRKKFGKVDATSKNAALNEAYAELPNLIALATKDEGCLVSNTLITFKPSTREENVLYMVTDRDSTKACDLRCHPECAFTTWYAKSGLRLHSNQATAVVLEDELAESEIAEHPEILKLSENAANQAVIKLTFSSIVIESFQKAAQVLTF
ncbi:pyridoxamine 5'-phosphate oxidase family protein [Fructobacillus sp. CRL 2054]|uniref:pyridoxamine 5'-phosphate oxidase family protein n=1 Tax=Fructobacillus sp. CRL 2054 TaxID=2763007 RepID=UPI002378D287|nr:pyridoxamine 5'-phosphate oxidase family protein [Fructobacillus sp. CRL 2054]MDD9138805.1 pyridoxamine 5'-phosphate oxidase family protein [Fructobacillus sp. CRL 2054]